MVAQRAEKWGVPLAESWVSPLAVQWDHKSVALRAETKAAQLDFQRAAWLAFARADQ